MATSEVLCSTLELAKVEGKKIGVTGFKLVTHKGNITVVSAEAGLAEQSRRKKVLLTNCADETKSRPPTNPLFSFG